MTSTVPDPAGLVAVQLVALAQATFVPAFAPKLTVGSVVTLPAPSTVARLVPVIVTTSPPAVLPLEGAMEVTLGTTATGGCGTVQKWPRWRFGVATLNCGSSPTSRSPVAGVVAEASGPM